MACDASHLREQVHVDLNRLCGHVQPDPAEFSAEEDLLRPEYLKKSEGDGENGGETIEPTQKDHVGPLTFSPTPSLDQSQLLEASTQANDDQAELMHGTTDLVTCRLFN